MWFPVVKFAIHMDVKYEDARAIRGSAEASNLDADFLGLSIVYRLLAAHAGSQCPALFLLPES